MHLLLVRHGETEWNVERRIQGWTDSPLTVRGIHQLAKLGGRLASVPIRMIYCSPSTRTILTARAVAGARNIETVPLDGLKETSWGNWEGKTSREIAAAEPELWEQFLERGREDPGADQADWEATTLVPGGETLLEASNRINDAVDKIIARHSGTDDWVVIIGHGGSLRFVIASQLNLRPASSRLFHLDNASVTHLTLSSNRPILKLLNDSSHWSEGILP